jgi:hypothetical protein
MSTDILSLWGAIQRGDTHEIASHIFPQGPQQPMPGSPALVERPSPTTGIRTADAGTSAKGDRELYPVTCRARYYDAASRILEDELGLHSHDNADELGHVIQKWIEETRNNSEPR